MTRCAAISLSVKLIEISQFWNRPVLVSDEILNSLLDTSDKTKEGGILMWSCQLNAVIKEAQERLKPLEQLTLF